MTRTVDEFRQLDNHVRPHETLAGARAIERYLADLDTHPDEPLNATAPTRQNMQIS